MSRRLPPPLVAISPGDLAPHAAAGWLARVRAAVRGGLRGLLVREPRLPDRPVLGLAREARELLGGDGWLAVHDRVHLAAACGADAVHLGFRSLAPERARAILDGAIAIGLSTHAGDEPAPAGTVDYVFFGPVRDTPSKRGWKEPVGIEGLAEAARRSRAPVWAIGGLRPEDAAPSLAAGASGIAVLSGILGSADPAAACAAYLREIGRARSPR